MSIRELGTFEFSLWKLDGDLQFEHQDDSDHAEKDCFAVPKSVPLCLRRSPTMLRKVDHLRFTSDEAEHGTLQLWCPLHGCCHGKSRTKEIKLEVDKETLKVAEGKPKVRELTVHQRY
jgi:hypothetical protein